MAYSVELPDEAYYRAQVRCQDACPVGTDARGYVRAIAEGDFERAYLIARAPNPLASICGRVCGAPCEAACRRGAYDAPVAIRALKRAATERFGVESGRLAPEELLRRVLSDPRGEHEDRGPEELAALRARLASRVLGASEEGDRAATPAHVHRVAIIGSGPAGLACSHDLALLGQEVVVYELEAEPAGMLVWGIPEYRLPRDLVRAEVEVIRSLGVEFRCNTKVGVDVSFEQLLAEYDAVVIAVGAKTSRRLDLPGIDGPGVLGGVEFLHDVAAGSRVEDLGTRVVVIGGGNVAYDVARTALRQVASDVSRTALRQSAVEAVTLVSLERLEELPADDVEILEGEEEGVRRLHALGPDRIERDEQGRVRGVWFKRCLRVFDEGGRFAPRFDEEDRVFVECDTVLLAVGQALDLSFLDAEALGIEKNERGALRVDPDTGATTHERIFVSGDCAYGPRLLIHAVADGKKVARAVYERLTGRSLEAREVGLHRPIERYLRERDYEKIPRARLPIAPVEERLRSVSAPVEKLLDEASARREAARCLDCGVNPVFDGSKCVLCGGCVDVCPESCLKIVPLEELEPVGWLQRLREGLFGASRTPVSAILKDEEICIRCGLCAERCPNGAVTMERFCFEVTYA